MRVKSKFLENWLNIICCISSTKQSRSSWRPTFESDGKVISQLIWAPFVMHPEYLTTEMERALHAVSKLAEKMCFKVDCQVGDIQLINNLALLHAHIEASKDKSRSRPLSGFIGVQ